jgi:hypothetical protein
MRTTVDIPTEIYRQLKIRAAREGRPANALILRGIEQVLNTKPASTRRRVKLPIIRSKRPGALRLDNARIYDVISFP